MLSSVVQMFRVIHLAGAQHNSEEGDSEAPSFDTLVALRLAIALMQARKLFHALIRNRWVLHTHTHVCKCLMAYVTSQTRTDP